MESAESNVRPLPQPPFCRGIPLGNGEYSGCSYGYGDVPQFSGGCDCPVCHGSGMEGDETSIEQALFSQSDWLQKLKAELRAELKAELMAEIRGEIAAEFGRREPKPQPRRNAGKGSRPGVRDVAAFAMPIVLFVVAGVVLWVGVPAILGVLLIAAGITFALAWRHRPEKAPAPAKMAKAGSAGAHS